MSRRSGKITANNDKGSTTAMTAEEAGVPNESAEYIKSLQDPDVVERVRCVIKDAHVFKLPPRPTSGGWRGADWREEVWQGTVKVVERGEMTLVLLVDKTNGQMFAVCPIKDGAVDRCVDSSRYFVLRIENANGRHMFIGMAFNERNDAFDFNTSLEDAKREREAIKEPPVKLPDLPSKDYSIKEGEKITVNIKNKIVSNHGDTAGDHKVKRPSKVSATSKKGGFALKPSSRDTQRRSGD
ncbi:DUF1681 domain containing protein [Nitzschia inconspicua]|uniref:DUF1681 domain containing protein n=1 Tax=Nitzschia inconspicua TaxID=303405 RepID=A0A9K3L7D2_9STRA|nr:DUF1681 domain containing protein [Nitzschia inconspicua]